MSDADHNGNPSFNHSLEQQLHSKIVHRFISVSDSYRSVALDLMYNRLNNTNNVVQFSYFRGAIVPVPRDLYIHMPPARR